MFKHSLPSIEKFAAFLDGNLSHREMNQISQLAEYDSTLHQMIDASTEIDDTIAEGTDTDMQMPPEIASSDIELPEIDEISNYVLLDDSFFENVGLYQQEGISSEEISHQESESLNNINNMANSYRTYGESGENIYDPIFIKQPDDHSCALRSQQIVLRDFGIDIPFNDLEKIALDAGVYTDQGTYTYDIGKVLEIAGVGMHQVPGSTIYDLANELVQGHRVIVSVDAHELWDNSMKGKLKNWFNDVIGEQGGNHALIVAGIEVNPFSHHDVKVVLTDPGAGHLRVEYPLDQFMDAWQDSNCFMAATDNAAPYQYDAMSGMEVPSNFAVEHYYNQFVLQNSYQLSPDMINVMQELPTKEDGLIDVSIHDTIFDNYAFLHDLDNYPAFKEFIDNLYNPNE